jgi:Protein of unknown function (DUF3300).
VALYPDNLLSQVLMASTYPTNVLQAVQWSQDNPSMKGDAAVQAVANQPWDPSVKSLVAFPALLSLMGENPQWVQDLGNAFLAQPQDVMDSVQKLRAVAQQTGTLKSSPQQKVTTTTVKAAPVQSSSSTTTTTTTTPAPTTQVIKIESADPNVVYVPTYNPNTVYGTWPSTAYPPVYLPPTPGQQFTNSFVNGLGFSLGVATTYALFSNIDWDDDHHHDDYYHDGGWHGGGNNNININVNNYNHITNQHLNGNNVNWQHNPAYRNNVPYPNNNVAQHFHQTNVPGGLSATQHTPANLNSQRQAALNQFQHSTHNGAAPGLVAGGAAAGGIAAAGSRDAQRQAASSQLHQITQRNNYRGYDGTSAKQKLQNPTAQQQQRRENAKAHVQNPTAQQQQRREQVQQHHASVTPQQHQQRQQQVQNFRANALSGNDSRSPSWEAQRQRGTQSRNVSGLSSAQRSAVQQHVSQHRELRHR